MTPVKELARPTCWHQHEFVSEPSPLGSFSSRWLQPLEIRSGFREAPLRVAELCKSAARGHNAATALIADVPRPMKGGRSRLDGQNSQPALFWDLRVHGLAEDATEDRVDVLEVIGLVEERL
jgi:hypothetical protein